MLVGGHGDEQAAGRLRVEQRQHAGVLLLDLVRAAAGAAQARQQEVAVAAQAAGIDSLGDELEDAVVQRHLGDPHERVVYLTFDEGWEMGTTARIIGILERAHVRASFFLTGQYIRANRGLTRRLAAHGYLLCNHTWSHPDMVTKAWSRSAFTGELRATERAYHAATGGKLARFFRPPFGTYSARSLQLAEQLGYTTVFWSFAHYDYDEGVQPPVSVTLRRILSSSCPGAIYLLHASSSSNVNALANAIRGLKAQGDGFATLDELRAGL